MSTTPYEPAFPVVSEIMGHCSGMTLRDYFAAKAMQGMLTRPGSVNPAQDAVFAYHVADAMLEARRKE
jgi:hypothetical protein